MLYSVSLPAIFPIFEPSDWFSKILSGLKVWFVALTSIPSLKKALNILRQLTVWQAKLNREFQAFQGSVAAERQELAAQPAPERKKVLQAKLDAKQNEITKLEVRAEEQRQKAGLTVKYGSLLEFVTDRLEDDSYQKRLGLMHQIKRDLEDLSDRLTCDLKNPNPDRIKALRTHFPRGVARVVLYIDDLDRCPPNRVVEVLEAVQLLLTTKLFIVVIAIDDRYINRALENTYRGILKRRGTPSGVDYLEKIIQIPYRMRNIAEKSVLENYLKSQLDFEKVLIEEVNPDKETEDNKQPASNEGQTNGITQVTESPVSPAEPETDQAPSAPPLNETTTQQSQSVEYTSSNSPGEFIEISKFTQEEFQIILNCCQYVDLTPRTTKRIVNLCKILKLIWTPTPNDARWKEEPSPAVKETVIAFLALSGRYPNQIRCVLEELYNNFEDKQLDLVL
ncbi:hypothetical protein C8255_21380 [filamentous cyanobacterium CCP3]|nr:hypothetical protein C8255_21380 [filamentous cyanobacterium CCP3]